MAVPQTPQTPQTPKKPKKRTTFEQLLHLRKQAGRLGYDMYKQGMGSWKNNADRGDSASAMDEVFLNRESSLRGQSNIASFYKGVKPDNPLLQVTKLEDQFYEDTINKANPPIPGMTPDFFTKNKLRKEVLRDSTLGVEKKLEDFQRSMAGRAISGATTGKQDMLQIFHEAQSELHQQHEDDARKYLAIPEVTDKIEADLKKRYKLELDNYLADPDQGLGSPHSYFNFVRKTPEFSAWLRDYNENVDKLPQTVKQAIKNIGNQYPSDSKEYKNKVEMVMLDYYLSQAFSDKLPEREQLMERLREKQALNILKPVHDAEMAELNKAIKEASEKYDEKEKQHVRMSSFWAIQGEKGKGYAADDPVWEQIKNNQRQRIEKEERDKDLKLKGSLTQGDILAESLQEPRTEEQIKDEIDARCKSDLPTFDDIPVDCPMKLSQMFYGPGGVKTGVGTKGIEGFLWRNWTEGAVEEITLTKKQNGSWNVSFKGIALEKLKDPRSKEYVAVLSAYAQVFDGLWNAKPGIPPEEKSFALNCETKEQASIAARVALAQGYSEDKAKIKYSGQDYVITAADRAAARQLRQRQQSQVVDVKSSGLSEVIHRIPDFDPNNPDLSADNIRKLEEIKRAAEAVQAAENDSTTTPEYKEKLYDHLKQVVEPLNYTALSEKGMVTQGVEAAGNVAKRTAKVAAGAAVGMMAAGPAGLGFGALATAAATQDYSPLYNDGTKQVQAPKQGDILAVNRLLIDVNQRLDELNKQADAYRIAPTYE